MKKNKNIEERVDDVVDKALEQKKEVKKKPQKVVKNKKARLLQSFIMDETADNEVLSENDIEGYRFKKGQKILKKN
jgi:hypothetical protein